MGRREAYEEHRFNNHIEGTGRAYYIGPTGHSVYRGHGNLCSAGRYDGVRCTGIALSSHNQRPDIYCPGHSGCLYGLPVHRTINNRRSRRKFANFVEKGIADKIPLLGLIRNLTGRCVVFIPSAPAVTLGQTYIVPAERVTLLDAPITSVVNTITQWGMGAGEIYKEK